MNTDQKRASAATFSVHVGVDTGKTFHKLVVRGPDGQRTKAYKVLVSRAGFEAADAHLKGLFPGVAPQRADQIVSIALYSRGRPGDVFRAPYGARPFEAPTTLPAQFFSQVTPDNPGAPRAPQARPGGPAST